MQMYMYIYTPRYVQFKKNYNIICNIVYNVHVCVCVGVFALCVSLGLEPTNRINRI